MVRGLIAGFFATTGGMFVLIGVLGISHSWPFAVGAALISGGVFGVSCLRSGWIRIDEGGCSPALRAVSVLAMGVALFQLSRLTVFMVSPSEPAYSFMPFSAWEVHHSCTTAYFVAAQAAGSGTSVYSDSLYTAPDDDPTKLRKPRKLGSFNIDVYEYPPPFLLLPRALLPLAPDFTSYRMMWFGLCGIVLSLGILLVAPLLGPTAGTRALLLSPLVWAAVPTISLMQKGNIQGAIIAISLLAMVLFHRGRWAAGGALLAFATLSKLFPGMLVVYLLAQKRWPAVAWTGVFSVVFVVVSVITFGAEMYRSFADHLPGLLSGEAFPAFRNPRALAMNFSIPAFVFKLKPFGLEGIDFTVTRVIGWIYTLVLVVLTIRTARKTRAAEAAPLVWLGILILATLRSPFIPQA
jgi:alpha-1,2-mannosyltransferase